MVADVYEKWLVEMSFDAEITFFYSGIAFVRNL